MKALCCLLVSLSVSIAALAQLVAGPMPGYSEMREAAVWVQTESPATVSMRYWPKDAKDAQQVSSSVATAAATANTALLIATEVEPGTTYAYEILVNGNAVKIDRPLEFQTQPLWHWRTDAPAFSFALGSCNYINEPVYDRPGTPYGGQYEIFETIRKQNPAFMLWLGDNTYLREADWNTRTGMLKRYSHTRETPEMQGLLSSCHHYAIWDDHDFGPNNSDRSFVHKDKSLEAFKLFWGNPTYGLDGEPGITSFFQWHDVDFYLLDNRYYRTPIYQQGESSMLGTKQVEWLIDALKASRAQFRIVALGSQFLNTAAVGENAVNYPRERETIIARIKQEGIKGVIFVTGDRHHTELSKLDLGDGVVIHDLTVSPLTSGKHLIDGEVNGLRVPETLVAERNFAIIDVSGPSTNRKLSIQVIDAEGKELWDYSIRAE